MGSSLILVGYLLELATKFSDEPKLFDRLRDIGNM